MDVKTGLFYFFAILLLIAAFRVITARNPVHAVLYLVLAFFQLLHSGCCSRQSFSPSPWCWSTLAP